MVLSLRPYQESSVLDIRNAFLKHKRVLYALPTGGGKTRVFSYIATSAEKKGRSVTVLVHREELVTQASLSLAENEVYHRIIAPGKVQRDTSRDQYEQYGKSYLNPMTDIVVASVQTLVRRFDKLPPPDLLIFDEAHHCVTGSTWGKIMEQYPEARSLGVTATPIRLDGRGLDNCFDHLVKGVSMQELITMGYLCQPTIFSHEPPDMSGVHTKFGDYQKGEAEEVMSRRAVVGDAVEHYGDICRNVPAIAFCVSVRHSELMAERFCQAGFRAIALDGKTDKNIRKGALAALGRGDIDVITTCDLISEGVDVPLAGAAILLRPTQSLSLYLQQAGRVLRPYPVQSPVMRRPHMQKLIDGSGQHFAYILDHAGNRFRHGNPQVDRNWSLTTDKKKGKGRQTDMVCPRCGDLHPASMDACPVCGYSYVKDKQESLGLGFGRQVEEVDGRLVEISDTPDWAMGMSLTRSPLKGLLQHAHAEAHYRQVAAARGYKQGWVHFVMKERYGKQD
jgi:superfamily II DNA or RNA helicase